MNNRSGSTAVDLLVAFAALLALPLAGMLLIATISSGGKQVALVTGGTLIAATAFQVWRGRHKPDPGSVSGRLRQLGVATFRVAGISLTAALAAAFWASIRPPADDRVEARFRGHRGELELLREMALEDELASVSRGGARYAREPFRYRSAADAGISESRATDYRRLLGEVGCKRLDVFESGSVDFALAGFGFASRGWRMSIAWRPNPPAVEELVDSVDRIGSTAGKWIYRRLDGDWYIAFIW